MALCLFLSLVAQPPPAEAYARAIARADSQYQAQRYVAALGNYERAARLLPEESGPRVGIGWSLLRLGLFPEAETAFRGVLARVRDTTRASANARLGLKLLPASGRFTATAGALAVPGLLVWSGFAGFRHGFRTTLTLGLQGVCRADWQGFNSGAVLYHRLDYRTALRMDVYGLSAFNKPRYWQMVFAPGAIYFFDHRRWSKLTFVGWDKLSVYGVQVEAGTELSDRLSVKLNPAFNRGPQGAGLWVPGEIVYRLPPVTGRLSVGVGSIGAHADLSVPTIYNQTARLTAGARLGADWDFLRRCRLLAYAAWERYGDETQKLYPSLSISVRF
jgi:tetratricopeptide (TPR) repeat protein